MLQECESSNPHGGGIAWLGPEGRNKQRLVKWKKGLTALEIQGLIESENIKPPALIHFRIATVGGKDKTLCHPFPVSRKSPTALEGVASKVLIHNGHWDNWCSKQLWGLISKDDGVPSGKWSDSRAMAWLTHHFGEEILKFIPAANKIATLDSSGSVLMYNHFTNEDGIYYSNTSWKPRPAVVHGYKSWENTDSHTYDRGSYYESPPASLWSKSKDLDRWGNGVEECPGCGLRISEKYSTLHFNGCGRYLKWLREDNDLEVYGDVVSLSDVRVARELEQKAVDGMVSHNEIISEASEDGVFDDEKEALERYFENIEAEKLALVKRIA